MTQADPNDLPISDASGRPGPGATAGSPPADPVVARRRRAAHLAATGKRLGYLLYGLAIVLFVVAMATGLPRALAVAIVASMAVGSVLLAPSIVVSYGVKAADREDRERAARGGIRYPAGPSGAIRSAERARALTKRLP